MIYYGVMKTVLTYGTFDLLHYGHIEIFRRAKELSEGGKLIVAISTDEFNKLKGKKSRLSFEKRKELVQAIRYVDEVIPEENWEQKKSDVKKHGVDLFVMGSDWKGKFDELEEFCEVHYLERTPTISSSALKRFIAELEAIDIES